MKKILCGTDFSDQAGRAARAAAALARRFGDGVVLVHVLEPPTTNVLELATDARVFEHGVREAAQRALENAATDLRGRGIAVETALLSGEPYEALVSRAHEMDARMIVLGSHGRHAPWRWFVGSVAERTQRAADRPVLIVHGGEAALGRWATEEHPLRVMVCIDASDTSTAPIEWVKTLRTAGPCRITFVHATAPLTFQSSSRLASVLERDLRGKLGTLAESTDVAVRVVPNWNTDAETLVHYADVEQMDLIVVGTHQRRGTDLLLTGSVARDVVRYAAAPVLTVPTVDSIDHRALEMPRFHTIVAVTDLTESANVAVPYAYGMARTGGTVVLCFVTTHFDGDSGDIERKLRALEPADAAQRGIQTHVVVRKADDPARAIVDAAEHLRADALCMSSGPRADRIPRVKNLPLITIRT